MIQHPQLLRTIEWFGYAIGLALLLWGLANAAILVATGGSWQGPLSLRKAATFGLSFGLTLVNVTFIASFVPLKDRTRTLLLGIFTAACVLETFLVSLQAWRGVPSHFNVETPFDAAVAQLLAFGGFTLVAVIVVLTVAAFRAGAALPASLRTAIRGGLAALVGWLVFAGLLAGRSAFGWRGPRATRGVYAGAALLLLAYVGSRFVLEVVLHRPPAS